MQSVENATSQIKELIQHARQVLVVTSATNPDGIAATLALANSIKSFGREVAVINPAGLPTELANLPGAQEIKNSLGPRSFVISINYQPNSIERVSYNTEGNKFNMVITPRNGSSISADQVDYSYSGQDYDLVIAVGVPDLGLLGKIYESEKNKWAQMPLINIDRHPTNAQFGKVNAIDPDAVTISEVTARVILGSKLPFAKESAELLLYGLRAGTNDFTEAGAATFEVAAQITSALSEQNRPITSEERLVNEPFRNDRSETEGDNVAN